MVLIFFDVQLVVGDGAGVVALGQGADFLLAGVAQLVGLYLGDN